MGDPRAHRPRTALGALAAALAVAVSALAGCASGDRDEDGSGRPAAVRLPPKGAGFDYQIGGAYPPPKGVRVVSRDRSDSPAPGLYNICYVNAFQAQPAERSSWPADLPRDHWLATDEREGHPVRIGAVTDQPDDWLSAI
ncbi:endo alpha-1,4 polygalactosaminidase, partial [Streptomyces achromogenes]|uniref:endo alpha-1,4 polygalactosaminidase n=1 Tax=Streptomyces achromogenes TaxID=67255 RepID=UPI003410DD18